MNMHGHRNRALLAAATSALALYVCEPLGVGASDDAKLRIERVRSDDHSIVLTLAKAIRADPRKDGVIYEACLCADLMPFADLYEEDE